jgi:hypothetical protein
MSNRSMSTWQMSNIDFLSDNNVACSKVDFNVAIKPTSLQTSLKKVIEQDLYIFTTPYPYNEPYLWA